MNRVIPQWTGEIVGKLHNAGIDHKDFALHMGIHPKYLSAILNGHEQPKDAEEGFKKALFEMTGQEEERLCDYTKVVVETDNENPTTIADITADTVTVADGYRIRLTPDYED